MCIRDSQGPMAAVRVGLLGDDFVLNPSYREIERGDLDLVVAGTPDGVVMVEAGANQLSEQDVIEAIDFGYEAITELINAQREVLKESGIKQEMPKAPETDDTISTYLEKNCTKTISEVLKNFEQTKEERDNKIEQIKTSVSSKIDGLKDDNAVKKSLSSNNKLLDNSYKALTKKLMRDQIIKEGKRVDGRELNEVRAIDADAAVLPNRVHGSALFQSCLLYTSPSPRDATLSRMPSSA